jgi:hypothetical protein
VVTRAPQGQPTFRTRNQPPAPKITRFYRLRIFQVIFTCVFRCILVVFIFPAIGTMLAPILHCVTM